MRPLHLRESIRPLPDGATLLPTLTRADWDRQARWWRTETGIPKRCVTCHGHVTNEPPVYERFGRVFCACCSRTFGWIPEAGWR